MVKDNEQMNNTANGNLKTVNTPADDYRYICTMDDGTFETKRAIINARNNAVPLNNIGDATITVIGVYITPSFHTQTGRKCASVYLFADDGNTYFTQSQGIYRSVIDIYDMFPDFNAPNGIPLAVKTVPISGNRTTKSLEIK